MVDKESKKIKVDTWNLDHGIWNSAPSKTGLDLDIISGHSN